MQVLIATDGSPAAERALELASRIAWPAATQLQIVSVVEPVAPILSADWAMPASAEIDGDNAELETQAQIALEHATSLLKRNGLEVSRRVMRGRPASRIVENAHDFAADLIIMGSRGHGTIASMILGSVSSEVVDQASCPVLIARGDDITRVVLGHDGSPLARVAESFIATSPIFANADIDVTSVARVLPPWTSGLALSAYEPPTEETAEAERAIVDEQSAIAEEAARRLRDAGRRATARVVEGDAATELLRVAQEERADLIVVGTHGRTGLKRLLIGSVARNVMIHAPCSVLVVRGGQASTGGIDSAS